MVRAIVLVIGLVTTAGLCDGKKNRDWRSGTIVDEENAGVNTGDIKPGVRGRNYDFGPGAQSPQNPSQQRPMISMPTSAVRETYVIRSDGVSYVATRLFESDKPSRIATMREVKFVVEKKAIIILDDKGREHKFKRLQPKQ